MAKEAEPGPPPSLKGGPGQAALGLRRTVAAPSVTAAGRAACDRQGTVCCRPGAELGREDPKAWQAGLVAGLVSAMAARAMALRLEGAPLRRATWRHNVGSERRLSTRLSPGKSRAAWPELFGTLLRPASARDVPLRPGSTRSEAGAATAAALALALALVLVLGRAFTRGGAPMAEGSAPATPGGAPRRSVQVGARGGGKG